MLDPFPRFGRQVLPALDPNFQADQFKSVGKRELKLIQLFQNLEKEKWQRRGDGQYPVFISLLENPGDADSTYSYHEVYLSFPEKQQALAEGKEQFMISRLPGPKESQEVVFVALLPDHPQILAMVKKALRHRFLRGGQNRGGKSRNKIEKGANLLPRLNGECVESVDDITCETICPDWDLSSIIGFMPTCWLECTPTCEGGSGGGGAIEPPDNSPDSGDPFDPGFGCQDTSGILCDNNSGVGAISDPDTPQDGSEQDCDAVSVDQAGECQPDPEPEPCKTSVEEVENALANVDSDNLRIVIKFVNEFGGKFGIDNETRLQHFLAQTAHESTSPVTGERFGALEENLNYSKETLLTNSQFSSAFSETDQNKLNPNDYAGNPKKMAEYLYGFVKDLGNTQPGDGWKFRGRGVIQLTGRDNYKRFTDFYQEEFNNSLDFTQNPDLLTSDDKIAVISGLWFFDWRISDTITDQTTVEEVTRQVNGGTNGLTDRENLFEKITQFITDCFA